MDETQPTIVVKMRSGSHVYGTARESPMSEVHEVPLRGH